MESAPSQSARLLFRQKLPSKLILRAQDKLAEAAIEMYRVLTGSHGLWWHENSSRMLTDSTVGEVIRRCLINDTVVKCSG